MSEPKACDLCGLDVGVKPFVLNTPEKQLQFCCEGCLGIFGMLHDIKEMRVQNSQENTQNQPQKS